MVSWNQHLPHWDSWLELNPTGNAVLRPEEDWITVEDTHEPLVDQATFYYWQFEKNCYNNFESYVFSEIYKSYLNAGKEPPIFYYRDKDRREIDLLLYQNGVLSPIEIKKAAIKHFTVLEPVTNGETSGGLDALKVEIGTGSVVCMANDLLPVDEKNWYVPAWLI